MHRCFRTGLIAFAIAFWLLPVAAQHATPAAPAEGVAVEPICTASLPAASIPEETVYLDFFMHSQPAGSTLAFSDAFLAPGTGIDCLVSGSYSMHSDGPLAIQRHGQPASERVPEGATSTLTAGDIVLILDNDHAQEFRVVGEEPAVIITVMIMSTRQGTCATSDCPEIPLGFIEETYGMVRTAGWFEQGLRGEDVTLSVTRVTQEAGVSLPTTDHQWPALRYVESGTLTWVATESGDAMPRSEVDIHEGNVVPYFRPEQGTTISLHNATGEPVTYLELTVTPAGQ
jgi:hypothetical protein